MVVEKEERYFKKTRPAWAIGLGVYLPGVVDDRGKKLVPYTYYIFQDKPGFYVGKKTYCGLMVRSGRSGLGYLWLRLTGYFGIKYDEKDCGSAYNKGFTPMEYQAIEGEFDLPNKAETKITFHGGHEVEGKWKEDFAVTVPIKPIDYKPPVKPPVKPPPAPPGKCKQWFKVVDQTGRGLGTASWDPKTKEILDLPATIEIFDIGYGTVVIKSAVFEGGVYRWDLTEGRRYRVKAWVEPIKGKRRYECIDCEREFVACTKEIVLTLKDLKPPLKPPIIGYCAQWVKVVNEKGVPIKAVSVGFVTDTLLVAHSRSGSDGRCSASLEEGKKYTVKAFKTGYECIDCEGTFTACTKEIVLTLKKKIIPKKCTQWIKVVDEKGIPIKDTYVGFFTDGLFTRPRSGRDGRASASLEEGKAYRLKVEWVGYTPSEVKFTACTKEIVVTLKKKPGFCTQSFKVIDEEGKPIADAHVRVVGVIGLVSGKDGKCSYYRFEEGKVYTVEAYKVYTLNARKYHRTETKKTFTACTKEIVLTLEKKPAPPKECKQGIKVVDEKKKPVGGVTVTVKGIGKKFTGADGKTSISLEEGKKFTVIAEKEGYECLDCERTFTACTKEIVLTLKWKMCMQPFKVVDEKKIPVDGATVKFFTDRKVVSSVYVKKDGKGSSRLTIGKSYTIRAEKKNYKCIDCERKITACTKEIVLTLGEVIVKPPPKKCIQRVRVIDAERKPVIAVSVSFITNGKVRRVHTGSGGGCSISLITGESYIVKAEKAGYECLECEKSFTACIEEIVLTIKKKEA